MHVPLQRVRVLALCCSDRCVNRRVFCVISRSFWFYFVPVLGFLLGLLVVFSCSSTTARMLFHLLKGGVCLLIFPGPRYLSDGPNLASVKKIILDAARGRDQSDADLLQCFELVQASRPNVRA